MALEFVPAFRDPPDYLIPDAAARRWIPSDPVAHTTYLLRAEEVSPGARHIIRLAKCWKSDCLPDQSSLYLEMFTAQYCLATPLQAKLDAAAIYTEAEVEAFVTAYLAGGHGAISAPLKAAGDRFNSRYTAAFADGDAGTVDELDLFRKDVGSFVRLYDFLSQIVNYADTDLEKRSLYLRLLLGRLTGRTGADLIDFSTVELTHIKQARSGYHDLDLGAGDRAGLRPVSATGTGAARDPRMVLLAEVLAKINDLFAGEDFTPAEQQSWVEGLVTVLMDDDTIRAQAGANTRKQFVESPDLSDAVTEAVLGNQISHHKMADYYFTDERMKFQLVKLLGELVHENLSASTR